MDDDIDSYSELKTLKIGQKREWCCPAQRLCTQWISGLEFSSTGPLGLIQHEGILLQRNVSFYTFRVSRKHIFGDDVALITLMSVFQFHIVQKLAPPFAFPLITPPNNMDSVYKHLHYACVITLNV